jgi:glycolate oxidase
MKTKGEENLSRTVTPEIIASLEDAIGKENITTSDMDRLMYSHDLAPLPKETSIAFKNIPDVVVRPKTVEGLATVMKIAFKNGVAVTPRGNSTWGTPSSRLMRRTCM